MAYAFYHEARHAYQFMLTGLPNNDEDHDYLVNNIPIAPQFIIVDTKDERHVCNEFAVGMTPPIVAFQFNGRGSFDAYGNVRNQEIGAGYAIEMDAHTFASLH